MQTQTFDASAGFHLANGGTDRNVILAEEICALEKQRLRVNNEPEMTRLKSVLEVLKRERHDLLDFLSAALRASIAQAAWPVWQTIMAVVFVLAGFGFTRMSFEPFDLDPELLWLCSVGIACLCAYATAEFLKRTDLKIVVLGLSIALFVLSVAGSRNARISAWGSFCAPSSEYPEFRRRRIEHGKRQRSGVLRLRSSQDENVLDPAVALARIGRGSRTARSPGCLEGPKDAALCREPKAGGCGTRDWSDRGTTHLPSK